MAADTRLDHRWIDLRTPANQAIFKIQSSVCQYFRGYLVSKVCVASAGRLCCMLPPPLLLLLLWLLATVASSAVTASVNRRSMGL